MAVQFDIAVHNTSRAKVAPLRFHSTERKQQDSVDDVLLWSSQWEATNNERVIEPAHKPRVLLQFSRCTALENHAVHEVSGDIYRMCRGREDIINYYVPATKPPLDLGVDSTSQQADC